MTNADNGSRGWRMPAETSPQSRVWMAWPSSGYTLGDTEDEAGERDAGHAPHRD